MGRPKTRWAKILTRGAGRSPASTLWDLGERRLKDFTEVAHDMLLAAAHGQKVLRECAHHGKPHCTPRAGSVTRRKEAVSGGLLTRATSTTRSDALGQSMGGTVKQILSPGKAPGAGGSHGRATASSRMAFPARPTRLRASSGSRPGRTTRGAGGMFSMVVRWHHSCTAPPEEGGML